MQWFPNPPTLSPPLCSSIYDDKLTAASPSDDFFFSFLKMFHSFASRWPLVKLLHGLPCSFSARVLQISNAVHPVTLGKSPAVPTTLLCPVLITWTPRRGYGYSYAPLLSTHYSFSLSVSVSLLLTEHSKLSWSCWWVCSTGPFRD